MKKFPIFFLVLLFFFSDSFSLPCTDYPVCYDMEGGGHCRMSADDTDILNRSWNGMLGYWVHSYTGIVCEPSPPPASSSSSESIFSFDALIQSNDILVYVVIGVIFVFSFVSGFTVGSK